MKTVDKNPRLMKESTLEGKNRFITTGAFLNSRELRAESSEFKVKFPIYFASSLALLISSMSILNCASVNPAFFLNLTIDAKYSLSLLSFFHTALSIFMLTLITSLFSLILFSFPLLQGSNYFLMEVIL